LATVVPHVSGPNEVKTMVSLPEMQRKHVAIQKAYLLSCVNARFEDLHDAAEVVRSRGGHVATGVEFYLAAASAEVQAKAESTGDWKTLLDAGAIPLPSGCGACIGLGRGLVEKGETAISATNRNFKGRMGDREALVYLGSPAVVAASALAGFICAPQTFSERPAGIAIRRAQKKAKPSGSVKIIEGFPASFSQTYKRNAFNNGFVVFECPELVTYLRESLKDRAPTTVGHEITIDYAASVLTLDGKSLAFPPLSPAAQELIVAGGAENL